MSMIMGSALSANSTVSRTTSDLRAAIADPHTSDTIFAHKLAAYREARDKAKENLTAAQKDLVDVLTVRQEAELAQMGLVP
jgi:hypothetical protein